MQIDRERQRWGHNMYMRETPMKPISELLLMNSKGKFLNPDEKQRVFQYAEEQRKKNRNKK